MFKFATPQAKVSNAARVEALTFYPSNGAVWVEFAIGHADEDGTFTEHERVAETIPASAVTPEMAQLATSVLAWVYSHLHTAGVLPAPEVPEGG